MTRAVAAAIIILVVDIIHPHKVFDPEDCLGICLFDGAVPIEQTFIQSDWFPL